MNYKILKSLLSIPLILTGVIFCYAGQSKLTSFPRPALTDELPEMEKTACVALDSLTKICQGLTDAVSSGAKFIIKRGGETIGEWQSEVYLGETTDYQVFRGDLDGDGRDELIVANRNSITSGISVNYWTIAVLPFPLNAEKLNPVQFQTEDFSVGAMFVPRRKSVGFDILAANWQPLLIKNSSSRTATHLVGRWLIYQNGRLEPLDRPILVRRYLSSFERERLKNINIKNNIYFGLNSPSTEKRRAEPLTDFFVETETDGTIENVILDENSAHPAASYQISVRTASGENLSLTYSTDAGGSKNAFDFIGNLAQKRLYPKNYLPDFKGKKVKLINYAKAENEPAVSRILWLTN